MEEWDESKTSCTITPNDKLWKITEKFNSEHGTNISYDDVAQANGIEDPNKIYAGDKLDFNGFINNVVEPTSKEPNYLVQGLIGTGEVLLGVAADVLTTVYIAGAETAALKTQGTLDLSVGTKALSGYTIGGLLMADGINMITSAFFKKEANPKILSLCKEIFLSSTYQDVVNAIQEYQKENKNDR